MVLRFLKFLIIFLFIFPSFIEASSTNDFDYLEHVELTIRTDSTENSITLANGTVYEDSKRTIFHSLQPSNKWHIQQFNYEKAWEYEALRPVKIAIIDTGSSVQQLADPRFQNGLNLIDPIKRPIDDNGHGTALGSVTLEVVGPYPVEVIPVKAADSTGSFTISNIVKAIDYAIEQQADIINLSFGAKAPHDLEQQAINKAIEAGIQVFSSSGNTGRQEYFYPAAYPDVISVGAITSEMKRASFSTYNDRLDFVAPGASLYVDLMDGGGALDGGEALEGTSFATAYLTGQYGVLKANSIEIDTATLARLATDLGLAGWDNAYGHGMIEVDKVLDVVRGKAWQTINTSERKKTWTIQLSKVIKSNQALAQHIKIYDAALVEQPVQIRVVADQTIEVTPSFELGAGDYWLVIDSGLQAQNGKHLKQPTVVKFVVE